MSRHRKAVTKMLLVLTGLALAAAVVVVARNASPYRVYVVRTDSMAPTIPPRSAVIVRVHEYRLGQVITFREAGVIMTHRFVAENADGTIATKGDDNDTIDPWAVQPDAVIGGVVAAPRMVGYWLFYIRNPFGMLSILCSVLAILQIWALGTPTVTIPTRGSELLMSARPRVDVWG